MKLKDKLILVTGSSRGIGAVTAQYLSEQGARVVITYGRSKESAENVFKSLKGQGHMLVEMDVSDSKSIENAFEKVINEFGSLDGLVNNAGITRDQLLLRMKESDFDEVINTNLKGTFTCTKLAVKVMMKAKKGSIVNVTSVIGQTGGSGQANYAASKAGIEAFSKSIAQEFGSRQVRVNCVAPGFIETDMTEELPAERKQAILAHVPLKLIGEPLDVAHSIGFLLSDESKYITGQTINVNGGMYM
jgi:3-oxoacyl-[acyl-carrier protein] reductase